VRIETDEIDRPIRIVHISDIQSASISSWEEDVLRLVAELEPDILVHTGDLVQPLHEKQYAIEYRKLAPLIDAIPAPLGRFNVPGDTDWPIRGLLQKKGAPFATLVNESHEIELGNGRRLRLLGIDVRTARKSAESRELIETFVNESPDAFNLVFAHPPDFVLEAQDYEVDLSLAGHTHGGQVRIPWFGPPVIGSRVPRHLGRGFHEFGRTRINTSAGVGAEHAAGLPSIRFNCPPEITIIELVPRTARALQSVAA
jgi:predicted MPP superfamily phosphohydrolase